MNYPKDHPTDSTISVFEHRGLDCQKHGDNVVHARMKGGEPQFKCVACLLEAAEQWLGFGT